MKQIPKSELILNHDGSLYHINLLPEDIAHTIITVGDPDRVAVVSKFFDRIELKKQKREFITHTGYYNNKRITVISTGIGTDNIDIVYNELDALVNIDLDTRMIHDKLTPLNLVRIGTSGSLQEDIEVDAFVCSEYGLGLDGLLNFYKLANTPYESEMQQAFEKHYPSDGVLSRSYVAEGSTALVDILSPGMVKGITASCSGFYGPQGRVLRYELARPGFIPTLNSFSFDNRRITNFEMETGAMYGLARVLGHQSCSVNAIVANRIVQAHSHKAAETMDKLIIDVLDKLCK